jgi:all-trans-retinol dehydrogenase (NAD+)
LDSVLTLLNRTALNPFITVPLFLASLYTQKGREEAIRRPELAKWLKRAMVMSLISKTTDVLGTGAQNNWKNDTYDWNKEIVVVTGGSDGIGAHIVKFLAEKGITVVILDIQEPKFQSKFPTAKQACYV